MAARSVVMNTVQKTFVKSDGTRKVEIFQRENGTFGFEEFEFGMKENSWYPVGRYSFAVIDTLETAIREAQARVSWLTEPYAQQ